MPEMAPKHPASKMTPEWSDFWVDLSKRNPLHRLTGWPGNDRFSASRDKLEQAPDLKHVFDPNVFVKEIHIAGVDEEVSILQTAR